MGSKSEHPPTVPFASPSASFGLTISDRFDVPGLPPLGIIGRRVLIADLGSPLPPHYHPDPARPDEAIGYELINLLSGEVYLPTSSAAGARAASLSP